MTKFYSAATGGFYDKQVHNHVKVIPDPDEVCPKVSIPNMAAVRPVIIIGDIETDDPDWLRPMVEIDDPHWTPQMIEIPNPETRIPSDAVEITDEEHVSLLEQQSGHGKEIRADETGHPIAVDPDPEPLANLQGRACKIVDTGAEAARGAFMTPGAGQAMAYREKEAEAEACQDDPDPEEVFYPFLTASLGLDGDTLKAVALVVIERRDAFRLIGADIEKRRLTAKAAIKAATTHEDIQTILDGLTWPQPEA